VNPFRETIDMLGFLVRALIGAAALPGILLGIRLVPAVIALEQPSTNARARPFQVMAFCLFLAAAGLFASAALADWFLGRNPHDYIGMAGVVALNLCAICGLRYRSLNLEPESRAPEPSDPTDG